MTIRGDRRRRQGQEQCARCVVWFALQIMTRQVIGHGRIVYHCPSCWLALIREAESLHVSRRRLLLDRYGSADRRRQA